jgi:hypothetical protein
MDEGERDLLSTTVRHILVKGNDPVAELEDLGWAEVAAADRAGATSLLFGIAGEELSNAPLLDVLVAGALGTDPRVTRLVLPLPQTNVTAGIAASGDGVKRVNGLALGGDIVDRTAIVVPLATSDGPRIAIVSASDGDLVVAELSGIDPELKPQQVALSVQWESLRAAPEEWSEILSAVRLALSSHIVGCARRMLDMAVEYAGERQQFGRPIGSFQAVKHHLADVLVAIESADSAVADAIRTGAPTDAEVAKVLAGIAGATASRWCLQVIGGIGFTWEHPLHRYIRRTLALDALAGSRSDLIRRIGGHLPTSGVARFGSPVFSQ